MPPLAARWNVAVDPRQVLAADGRAYVLVAGGVAALDQASGRQLWAAALPAPPAGAGYEGGALYVAAANEVVSLDAASGAVRWRRDLGGPAGTPVASGGAVYATRQDEIVAMKASDGAELWRRPGVAGADAPALDGNRAYLAGGCGAAVALARMDGAEAWRRAVDCADPGRAVAPALFASRLHVPSDGSMLDAAGGGAAGRFPGARPILAGGLRVQPEPAAVSAVDVTNGRQAWRSAGPLDDALAVGQDVFGFRGDRLIALAADDGRLLWSDARVVGPAGRSIAVAPGLLLVAGEGRLVAYGSALRPGPRGIAVGVDRDEVPAGTAFALVGVLGRELRAPGAKVRIEGADWPRGRYGRVSVERAARDGGFLGGVALYRSSRFRVRSGRALSPPVTVYAIPRVRLGSPRRAGRGRIAVAASVRTPRTRLDGLRLHLYLRRSGAKRLERVGSGRLRRAGDGRTKATLRFRPPTRTTRGDTLDFCIEKQLKLGLGKPSPLTRRCGERRLPA